MLEINSKINSHLITESKLNYKVEGVQSILTDEDYFHKAFLKPIQIALKNGEGELPVGLQLALKDDISDNKYKLTDFDTPNIQQWKSYTYEKIIQKNLDNLLSLLKCQEGIQIAICVCMYTEDKKMLKSTLSGVSKNIENFVKSGVSRDKIVVVVIMDGIEKVDDSVVEYFNELERESNIMLDNQTQPIGLHDFLYNNSSKLFIDKDEQQTNINNLLFTQAQLFDRQQRRFSSRVAEFKEIKNLSQTIQKLKNVKGLSYQILDSRIQKFFIEVAKERRKHEYGQDDEQLKSKDIDFFIDNYANDLTKSRPIIMQAMMRAKKFCDEYISTRSNLALLNYFRTGVFSSREENKQLAQIQLNETVIHSKMVRQSYDATQSAIHETTMNLLLCTKYKNLGKLSSHNWFFNGFCNQLQSKYSFLLDVGLTPQDNSLYKMYRHLVTKEEVGGACGYMGLRIQRNKDQLGYNDELDQQQQTDFITRIFFRLVDIQRAQQLEYHFAHLLDKSFEAQFKFIHVLPGAFSCYKMQALRMNNLLQQYFKSISNKNLQEQIEPSSFSPFEIIMKIFLPEFIFYKLWPLNQKSEEQMLYNQNIYLAEDRILCMGIHKNGKDISFIPDAYAWVDPIKNVHTLLGQRKRWINGTFFAFEKVKRQLEKSDKLEIGLKFQIYYLSFMNMMAYIAPSLFLFTVSIAVQIFRTDILLKYFSDLVPTQFMQGIVYVVNFSYIGVTVSIIFLSMHLTNKHKKFIPFIYAASTMKGIFATIITLILITDIFRGSDEFLTTNKEFVDSLPFDTALLDSIRWIIISIIIMYALPVLIYSLLYRKVSFAFDALFGAFSFLFFSPTYLNLLNIYALCRINDISWGTKGLDENASTKNKSLASTWNIIRLIHVSKYFFWNVVASMILLTLGSEYISRFFVTFFIMMILAITMMIKLSIGSYYLIKFYVSERTSNPVHNQNQTAKMNRIDELYFMIKPQMQKNIRTNIDRIARQMKQNRQTGKQQKSGIVWGGKSKLIIPKQKKNAMKECFQEFKKLNASRVIKNQTENQVFKNIQKQRISKNKDIYKRQKPHFTTLSVEEQKPQRKRKKKPANIKLKTIFNSTKEKQSVNKVRFKIERENHKQQSFNTDTISMTIKEGIDKEKFRRENTVNQNSSTSENKDNTHLNARQNFVPADSLEFKNDKANQPSKNSSLNSSFDQNNSDKKAKFRKDRIF